jgi:hypothetical protein
LEKVYSPYLNTLIHRILEDPSLKFNNRTSVDLKDRYRDIDDSADFRFRTYFPEDYKRLYPNATSTRERATVQQLAPEAATFSKAKRKERTPFSKAEDENLLIGFGKYGGKWSLIQKDETLGLQHRRSTDLRDRFRNAYPDKYIGAGFKPPPAKRRRRNDPEDASSVNDNQTIQTDPLQPVFQFHHDLPSHTPLSTASLQTQDATIPTPVRRELAAAIASAQPMNDTFSLTRLSWTNPHNVTAQREREMALKIRRAMDMSNPAEMLTDRDIPLDPGLSDVAYQPDEQTNNAETLTGLLDAASQHRSWKRE